MRQNSDLEVDDSEGFFIGNYMKNIAMFWKETTAETPLNDHGQEWKKGPVKLLEIQNPCAEIHMQYMFCDYLIAMMLWLLINKSEKAVDILPASKSNKTIRLW